MKIDSAQMHRFEDRDYNFFRHPENLIWNSGMLFCAFYRSMLEAYLPRNYFRFERLLGRFDRINLKAILHYWKLLHTSCSMQEKHNYDIYSER